MASTDVIEQRAFDRKTWFKFGEDKVEFRYVDPTGEINTVAYYEAIDLENKSEVKLNVGSKYIWITLVVALIVTFSLNATPARAFATVPILIYAAIVYGIRYGGLLSVRVTVLPVRTGNLMQKLRVIKNAKHDEVMERLRNGWVARVRKLYATVQPGADPVLET